MCQQWMEPLFRGDIPHTEHTVKWHLGMLTLLLPLEESDSELKGVRAATASSPKQVSGSGTKLVPIFFLVHPKSLCCGSMPQEWGKTHSLPTLCSFSLGSASQEPGNVWPRVQMAGETQWWLHKKYRANKRMTLLLACYMGRWVAFSWLCIYRNNLRLVWPKKLWNKMSHVHGCRTWVN